MNELIKDAREFMKGEVVPAVRKSGTETVTTPDCSSAHDAYCVYDYCRRYLNSYEIGVEAVGLLDRGEDYHAVMFIARDGKRLKKLERIRFVQEQAINGLKWFCLVVGIQIVFEVF